MKITFTHQSRTFEVDMSQGHDISRVVRFLNGPEMDPAFVPKASRAPFSSGGFVGAVEKGGSCNVDRLDWIPHCHGTHTETVAHILKYPWQVLSKEQEHSVPVVSDFCPKKFFTAALISVAPVKAIDSNDTYRPNFGDTDRIVSGQGIEKALQAIDVGKVDALILRTDDQLYDFNSGPETPFLSVEAMQAVVKSGVDHLLLDLPSVDRLNDDGHLTSHHIFWNVPEHESVATKDSWLHKTITEMVTIGAELNDGLYLLNLQCSPVVSDAAPSRAVIYPAH
ncbi:cyclase family protein [Mariniblastus fucicola]|uniref:Cyclase n=1 Tax=Mariniblastus fucicola TaxID=980251 RepID=A0A5B9PCS7_9BACT|nr:cyclase family protein [Mariniblastus fucicola]QEG24138.1 Putative cyclase [Mariniblastus fucicola]